MKLPTVEDFTCAPNPEDDLDGFSAWKDLGGLTIDEAYQKLCEAPEYYQEHFMWMGDPAFIFYYPVIDRHVREQEPKYEIDGERCPFDGVTHILAHCICMHVSQGSPSVRSLYGEIVKLCRFVLHGLENVPRDQRRGWSPEEIRRVWTELLEKTVSLMRGES